MPLLYAGLGRALQLVEGILAILGLVASCLWLTAHPVEFCAVEVIGPGNLGPAVVNALLPFLQVVGIVAAIGVDGLVVDFEDDRAYAVEEIAVVGDHEQRLVASVEKAFQPFYHFQVEVVGRLVEYQQVWLQNKHVGQGHTLLLAA